MAEIQKLMKPVAILDFGTNTFNLLIAQPEGNSFRRIYTGKQPVKLGKGGINKRTIAPDAAERGYEAIRRHMEVINRYEAEPVLAYATSAMRNASNGEAFANEVYRRFGFNVNIIPGDEEAALIYDGIRASYDFSESHSMIMDIGGGSNEIILCDVKGIHWKRSFELGMARIIDRFPLSDPIATEQVKEIEAYYASQLLPLIEACITYQPKTLVGASGTFDTLASMARLRFGLQQYNHPSVAVEREHFNELYAVLLPSTAAERLEMPGMEPVRVEMIVPAMIFIKFVMEACGLTSIVQSNYALKEGVMSRYIKNI